MKKQLSQMSIEELWELFPIQLTEHNKDWKCWFDEEKMLLDQILKDVYPLRIAHIGSTAIPAIYAKPIVDILIETDGDWNIIEKQLIQSGYIFMSQSDNRKSFNKGYTENGFAQKVFHLHLRHIGDNDELYFRDYLNEHLKVAKEYETMKLGLWKRFEHNRDAYTNHKTEFVNKYTKKAKKLYKNKYNKVTI
ncbi:GrpB family protein [Breznakia pachnodae]|uniref:GrpB-like predicted nucleotidyltransferase (UPF0157 family) n=1 Tax=Breznakia pachnodae TaxID=265178 RepID=A0ABU0DYL4_9FIRM|nr:GrpB family protein [Breznakia pachnodae]MDQ0359727.1 GrpB-like predicted nucleotidyltransferase (UPF0157 family) [Breznakia pachnodae]